MTFALEYKQLLHEGGVGEQLKRGAGAAGAVGSSRKPLEVICHAPYASIVRLELC